MPTTEDWSLIALILAFAALVLAGTMDAKDADRSQATYCEMVAHWGRDAETGVAPIETQNVL